MSRIPSSNPLCKGKKKRNEQRKKEERETQARKADEPDGSRKAILAIRHLERSVSSVRKQGDASRDSRLPSLLSTSNFLRENRKEKEGPKRPKGLGWRQNERQEDSRKTQREIARVLALVAGARADDGRDTEDR